MNLLPVKYTNQKNAWMTSNQFHEWFHHDFVPYVQEQLRSLGEEPNAVLVLDNCSAHPDPEDLVSSDGKIYAKYLPANVTALIQPMDQGVIQLLKKKYKKKLLHRLIIEDDMGVSIVDILKGVNLKVVADMVYEAWTEVSKDTLRKSWQKIIPITASSFGKSDPPTPMLAELYKLAVVGDEDEDIDSQPISKESRGYCIWRGLRIRIGHPDGKNLSEPGIANDAPIEDFQMLFQELGVEMESDEITSWLDSDVEDPGVQIYTDTEICEIVSQASDEVEPVNGRKNRVQYQTAMLLTCLNGVCHGFNVSLRPQSTTLPY